MKVNVDSHIQQLVISSNYMVAADQVQKPGLVCLTFTNGQGDRFSLEIAKGVALAVRDEIKRVTGSR